MRQFLSVPELEIRDVLQRGVPNQECIMIKPRVAVDMGSFAMFIGLRASVPRTVTPVRDLFFWFGEGMVQPEDWVFLFTGTGTPARVPIEASSGHYIFVYWGRPATLLHDSMYAPFILRFDAIEIASPPLALPQP